MNVGDYIRTKDYQNIRSRIGKIIKQDGKYYYLDIDEDTQMVWEEDTVLKSSPNIIDLIEVGDYVNGWRVNRVEKEEEGTILTCGTITSFVGKSEKDPYLTQDYNEADKMCKLKSIVTKEQFENMEYKVGEQ